MPRHALYYVPEMRDPLDLLLERVSKPTAEEGLALAVLEQAVLDLRRGPVTPQVREVYRQTREWVRSEASHAYSFEWLCGVFGIDPGAARESMLSITPQALQPHARPAPSLVRHRPRAAISRQGVKGARLGPRRWVSPPAP